jgi:hypothetical protein
LELQVWETISPLCFLEKQFGISSCCSSVCNAPHHIFLYEKMLPLILQGNEHGSNQLVSAFEFLFMPTPFYMKWSSKFHLVE